MPEYYVIPTIGKFKITITPEYDFFDKSKIAFYIINVGGNYDKCVNLTVHPEYSPYRDKIILSWAEVEDKECTVDSQLIKGSATITMLNLAFSIAREIAPQAKYISLNDMSYFYCDTPDGKKKVSLPPFNIAFHDKTWYEDKFNATMTNEENYIKYKQYIKNMYKENFMPTTFDFGNNIIKDMLSPLYYQSKTWKDFFNSISKKYSTTKCTLMYPWINNAMNNIFEGNAIYAGHEWTILLNNIPKIYYYQMKETTGGSDIPEKKYNIQYYHYRDINYNDTMKWDINTFLKKRVYTRKNITHVNKKNNTKRNIHLF